MLSWPQTVSFVGGSGDSPKQHHARSLTGENWNRPSGSVQASARCGQPADEPAPLVVQTTTVAPGTGCPEPSTTLPEKAPRYACVWG